MAREIKIRRSSFLSVFIRYPSALSLGIIAPWTVLGLKRAWDSLRSSKASGRRSDERHGLGYSIPFFLVSSAAEDGLSAPLLRQLLPPGEPTRGG
jgi:hypothetical protein